MKTKNTLIAICLLAMAMASHSQSIQLTSPAPGQVFNGYDVVHLTWTTSGNVTPYFVKYLPDSTTGLRKEASIENKNGAADIVLPNMPSTSNKGLLIIYGRLPGSTWTVEYHVPIHVNAVTEQLTVDMGPTQTGCQQSTAELFAHSITGGTPPYTINWLEGFGGRFNRMESWCTCDTFDAPFNTAGGVMQGYESDWLAVVEDANGLKGIDTIHMVSLPVPIYRYPILGIPNFGAHPCGISIPLDPGANTGTGIVSARWRSVLDNTTLLDTAVGTLIAPAGATLLQFETTDSLGCVIARDTMQLFTYCGNHPLIATHDCITLGAPDSISGVDSFYFLHVLDNDVYDTATEWTIQELAYLPQLNDPSIYYPNSFLPKSKANYITLRVNGSTLSVPDSFQYELTSYYSTGTYDTAWVYLNKPNCQPAATGLVWPGDADNNGVVDNVDLLPIGIGYGSTGPVRDSASLNWVGQTCADWNDSLNGGTNYKFVDCDGNGTINADDTLAIHQNFLLTHPRSNNADRMAGAPVLHLRVIQDTIYNGDTLHLEISLADADTVANNVYGIAFDINFDPRVIDTTLVSLSYPDSWLGATTELITLTKYFNSVGNIKTAVTRFDHLSKSGHGPIAYADFLITTGNINGKDMEYYSAMFSTSNITMVDEGGNRLDVNPSETNTEVGFIPTGINDAVINNLIKVYPNPAKDRLSIKCAEIAIEKISITDLAGKEVIKMKPSETQNADVDVAQLSGGMYFLQITTNKGISIKRLAIGK